MVKQVMVGAGVGAALMGIAITQSAPVVERWEGTRYTPYKDIVGVLTVCQGHTGPDIVVNKVYSKQECRELTEKDLNIAMTGVLKTSPHLLWHPMQLAAAISFSYNVGTGTYANSSVARRFNAGDFHGGCEALKLYKYAGGKIVQGLINRREHEYNICISTLSVPSFKNLVQP